MAIGPPAVGGSTTGLALKGVRCENVASAQVVVIPATSASWDCEANGLVVKPEDKIRVALLGKAK